MWDFALKYPEWFLAWQDDRKAGRFSDCEVREGSGYREPELAGLLTQAIPEQLRAVSLAMCKLAMEMLPGPLPVADRAFAAVLAGDYRRPFDWVDLAEAAAGAGREWFWLGDLEWRRRNVEKPICRSLWAALGDEPRIAAVDSIDCARDAVSNSYAPQRSSADPWPDVRAAVLRALEPLTDEQRTTMLWWQRVPAPYLIMEVEHRLPDSGFDVSL